MAGVTFVRSYLSTFSLCNSGQPTLLSSLPKAGKITIRPAVTSNRQMASEFPAIVILFFWVVLQIVTGFSRLSGSWGRLQWVFWLQRTFPVLGYSDSKTMPCFKRSMLYLWISEVVENREITLFPPFPAEQACGLSGAINRAQLLRDWHRESGGGGQYFHGGISHHSEHITAHGWGKGRLK